MDFEETYDNIVNYLGESAEKAGITLSKDLKSFLQKNIGNLSFVYYRQRNDEYFEHVILKDSMNEYSMYLQPAEECLVFISHKKENMSDIISTLDSTMSFRINGNEYGETNIEKKFFKNNELFEEIYDIDKGIIETSVYSIDDIFNKYKMPDQPFDKKMLNFILLYNFNNNLNPITKVNAQIRGKYFVIDSGEEHLKIPRTENTTLYSVYHDYMVKKGYYDTDEQIRSKLNR